MAKEHDLVTRLLALTRRQREERGDRFYRGEADPEVVEAIGAICRLTDDCISMEQTCREIAERALTLQSENDALKHDIERHLAIISDLHAEQAIERAVGQQQLDELTDKLTKEYICTCGQRVEPHRCRDGEGF